MKNQIIKSILVLIASITINFNTSAQCVQCDENSNASGNYSSVIGMSSLATADGSFAGGFGSEANGALSFAFGNQVIAGSTNSVAFGRFVETTASPSIIFGTGVGLTPSEKLINNVSNSLMIGFNSNRPTLFVGMSDGLELTGSIGIGDVTDPKAKLHIKADNNENVDLLLEPGSSGNFAKIKFGEIDENDSPNRIEAKQDGDLNFYTASDYVFRDGNVFIEDINSGIVMKSPDGQCWRGKMDNTGNLQFEAIDCDLLTKTNGNKVEPQPQINIFPNPANDVITIMVIETNIPLIVQILNMKSELVLSRTIQSEKTKIKTKKLPAGNYIIKISEETGKAVHTEKVVVL